MNTYNMQFYIDGAWVEPAAQKRLSVTNPATESVVAEIGLGSAPDVDRAVMDAMSSAFGA